MITGVFYECNPVSAPYVVYDPKSFVFAGTGVRRGTAFPGLVGPEYDRLNSSVPFPRPLEVLAHSTRALRWARDLRRLGLLHDGEWRRAACSPNETMHWVYRNAGKALCARSTDVSRAATSFVDRATDNLLRAFAAKQAQPTADTRRSATWAPSTRRVELASSSPTE